MTTCNAFPALYAFLFGARRSRTIPLQISRKPVRVGWSTIAIRTGSEALASPQLHRGRSTGVLRMRRLEKLTPSRVPRIYRLLARARTRFRASTIFRPVAIAQRRDGGFPQILPDEEP